MTDYRVARLISFDEVFRRLQVLPNDVYNSGASNCQNVRVLARYVVPKREIFVYLEDE